MKSAHSFLSTSWRTAEGLAVGCQDIAPMLVGRLVGGAVCDGVRSGDSEGILVMAVVDGAELMTTDEGIAVTRVSERMCDGCLKSRANICKKDETAAID